MDLNPVGKRKFGMPPYTELCTRVFGSVTLHSTTHHSIAVEMERCSFYRGRNGTVFALYYIHTIPPRSKWNGTIIVLHSTTHHSIAVEMEHTIPSRSKWNGARFRDLRHLSHLSDFRAKGQLFWPRAPWDHPLWLGFGGPWNENSKVRHWVGHYGSIICGVFWNLHEFCGSRGGVAPLFLHLRHLGVFLVQNANCPEPQPQRVIQGNASLGCALW